MVQMGFKTDRGLRRQKNEDSYFVMPAENVFVVADGVGGENAGEVASRKAVTCVAEYVKGNPIENVKNEEELRHYFKKCFDMANRMIFEMSQAQKASEGMATTMVVAYILENKAYIINVGDSRAYIFREGRLNQITEDHTYVNTLIQKGLITNEQASRHPDKNMITRAIGGEAEVEPDFFRIELQTDDIIMICSDGLYGEVEQERIEKILGGNDRSLDEICKELVDRANRNGGRDNITVICLKI